MKKCRTCHDFSFLLIEQNKILEGLTFNVIPPRVEYKLTTKGQELVASKIILL